MRGKGWIALGALALTGCVSVPKGTVVPLTDEVRANIETATRRVMKDPDSAQFGEIAGAQTPEGTINVCGMVNAKNSFGGYVGSRPFFGVYYPRDSYFEFRTMADSASEFQILRIMCENAGVPVMF